MDGDYNWDGQIQKDDDYLIGLFDGDDQDKEMDEEMINDSNHWSKNYDQLLNEMVVKLLREKTDVPEFIRTVVSIYADNVSDDDDLLSRKRETDWFARVDRMYEKLEELDVRG